MNKNIEISQNLKELLEDYMFSKENLAKYLSLNTQQIQEIADGNVEFFKDDNKKQFEVYNKIMFLSLIPKNSSDFRVGVFLEVLISYHKLSKETIAKMADVEVKDVESMLSNPDGVSIEAKYKISVAVMSLRFFFKENEPKL